VLEKRNAAALFIFHEKDENNDKVFINLCQSSSRETVRLDKGCIENSQFEQHW
jgi:hypothetical protein